ncbi:ParM/StbA family protein [Geotalea sp. SG265]|uniref:ParM/StbA family protein n=1 Tax=Geotalea sp. SG265 TaxID=2922867 RepID=UPI001FAEDD45|nr:ParM/StbA family protein [Geotalea sp. SG265]
MKNIVAIDTGFSFTKVYTRDENGAEQTFSFPSIIQAPGVSAAGLDTPTSAYFYHNAYYTVGKNDRTKTNLLERDIDSLIKFAPLLVAHALKQVTVEPDVLVVGLPFHYFNRYKDQLRANIASFWLNGENHQYPNVVLQGQALGALADHFATVNPAADESGYILDVGFNTILALRYEHRQAQGEGSTPHDRKGVSVLVADICTAIQARFGVEINEHDGINVLLTKKLKLGKEHDVSDIISSSVNKYLASTVKTFRDKHRDYLTFCQRIVLVGGGAYVLKNNMPKEFADILHIPDNPEFSNARGYWKMEAARHGLI